jgi:hypothetical protein
MSKRVKIILIIVGIVVLGAGAATIIFWPTVSSFVQERFTSIFGKTATSPNDGTNNSNGSGVSGGSITKGTGTAGTVFAPEIAAANAEVDELLESASDADPNTNDGAELIQKADERAAEEIEEAEQTGNVGYTFDAYMTKVVLLIETGRAQEALDVILLPFEQEYKSNETYIDIIYGYISWAYSEVGNVEQSDAYYKLLPEKGWDE